MRTYFVSYFYCAKSQVNGYGCISLNLTVLVRDMDVIKDMCKCIKKSTGFKNIVVLNWRRFEEPAALIGYPTAKEAA